ncbi:response regulator [bacterium]|nr:response regulator [bacterium]
MQVVVIEDEGPIRRFLKTILCSQGYDYLEATSGKGGLEAVALNRPVLVILDLGLPDIDGLEVIKQLRDWSTVPIIILSAREQEGDKVRALDLGADDYLTKPFGVSELLARIRAAVRRSTKGSEELPATFSFANVHVDFGSRLVSVDGKEVHLTPIEYKLLVTLIRHKGKVVTHNQLLMQVWGEGYNEETQYLRVYMAQLRRKLEADSRKPRFFLTEAGVGYRFKDGKDE